MFSAECTPVTQRSAVCTLFYSQSDVIDSGKLKRRVRNPLTKCRMIRPSQINNISESIDYHIAIDLSVRIRMTKLSASQETNRSQSGHTTMYRM